MIGLDFSERMLERARRKSPAVEWIQGDLLALPFEDASFDAATIGFGIRNVADLERGLAELRRVLRPGGRLAILEITRPRGPLRLFYRLWFDVLIPLAGKVLPGGKAYTYLPASVRRFPGPDELAAALDAAAQASTDVSYRRLAGGIVALPRGARDDERCESGRRAAGRGRTSRSSRSASPPGRRQGGRVARSAPTRSPRAASGCGRCSFLCAQLDARAAVAAGVAVELVHMATLVHDDLVDGAETRRGRAAAWPAHGADAARSAGDYLFARAFAELAADGDVDGVRSSPTRASRSRAARRSSGASCTTPTRPTTRTSSAAR